MRPLLLIAIAVLLALPSTVWAFRGRPVSDLRFESYADGTGVHAASDGHDFMLICTPPFDTRLYVQRFAGGVPIGPRLRIGRGALAGIVWTGNEYLAGWSDAEGLRLARISRDGAIISMPPAAVVRGNAFQIAFNGESVLAVGYSGGRFIAQELTRDGELAGPPAWPPYMSEFKLAPAGDDYAVVGRSDAIWLQFLGGNGKPLLSSPVRIDGPFGRSTTEYRAGGMSIAANDAHAFIVFATGRGGVEGTLKTAVVSTDGTVNELRTVLTRAGGGHSSFRPSGAIWNGTHFIAAFGMPNPSGSPSIPSDPALLQFNPNGEPIGEPRRVADDGDPVSATLESLTSSERDLLLTGFGEYHRSFIATIDPVNLTSRAFARTMKTANPQYGLTIAASGGEYLAAWSEQTSDGTTIRASRIHAGGDYLDGAGIVLAGAELTQHPTIAIDTDGTNWLVVFGGSRVRAVRLSRAGVVLDPSPIEIGGESKQVAVRWTGKHFVVAYANDSLFTASISGSRASTAVARLSASREGERYVVYRNPSVVLVDGEPVAVFTKHDGACGFDPPNLCNEIVAVAALELDGDNTPFEIAKGSESSQLATATDGTSALIAWSEDQGVFGAQMIGAPRNMATPFLIDASSESPSISFDGTGFVAAWTRFLKQPDIVTARISTTGTVTERTVVVRDIDETLLAPIVAADRETPSLLAFLTSHGAYDDVVRGVLSFAREDVSSHTLPSRPTIVTTERLGEDMVRVRWLPSDGALGISVELRLADGFHRQIGVAAGSASSADVSLAGATGQSVRLRAWNGVGMSPPSDEMGIPPPRRRAVGRR